MGSGAIASPVTYQVDGKQYVSIAVGWGGVGGLFRKTHTKENYPGTIFTFTLDAKGTYPDFYSTKPQQLINLELSLVSKMVLFSETLNRRGEE